MVTDRLSVYLHDHLAGYLWLSDTGRFSFKYDHNYLEDPAAIPLSLSLPMRKAPYVNDTARPFFSNLLPEGEVRSLIAKIKQISEKMAMKIGKETRFDWIMERHWQQMANQLDLKFSYLKKVLRETAEALEKNTSEMADDIILKYNGKKTIEKICRIISKHIKHVETYL